MSQIQTYLQKIVSQAREFQSEILVALVILVVCYVLLDTWREWRKNLPPGPYGLPVVGYIPFLKDPHRDLAELAKKYGDIYRLKLASETVVIITGVEMIKEALARPEFNGRTPVNHMRSMNKNSAFFMDGYEKWREQRRFVLWSMRDLGLGKTKIEGDIMDEIHHFLDKLRSHNGSPMDLKEPLSASMSNNICSLVFGKRYDYEDQDRMYMDHNLEVAMASLSRTSYGVYFPWLFKIPVVSKLIELEKAVAAFGNLKAFFMNVLKQHKDTYTSKNIRDFIDSFIYEQNSRQKKDPNTSFSDDTLVSNVLDLFVAGSETVRTSILWSMYAAAAFPEHQEKVLEEILEVMGPERDPEYQDMKSMPFTHSFILEVMRWKTIIPHNVPHCTLADTTLGGYHIPKGTTVLTSLWNANHDPKYWDDPDTFIPGRFISKDGKSVSRPAHYIPFGMGKRGCPGEPMAMMEMFLYFTSIIQKFQVRFPDGYKPTFKAVYKGTYRLEPYQIRFLPRNISKI